MADQPTKVQLVQLGQLSPPLDPVTEGEVLHLITGLVAYAEFGAEVLRVLEEDDPLAAIAQHVLDARGQEQTGSLTAASDTPAPAAPGPATPSADPRDQQIAQLRQQLADAQQAQVDAAAAPPETPAPDAAAATPPGPAPEASPAPESPDAPPSEVPRS